MFSPISEGFFCPEGPTGPHCYSKVPVLSEEQRRVIAEKRATAKLRRAAASERRRPQPKAASAEWRRLSGISQESPVQTVFLDLVRWSALSFLVRGRCHRFRIVLRPFVSQGWSCFSGRKGVITEEFPCPQARRRSNGPNTRWLEHLANHLTSNAHCLLSTVVSCRRAFER